MTAITLHKDWECARQCGSSARTYDGKIPHHRCRKMAGLLVPLIRQGTQAKIETIERGDYIGREVVQTDAEGQPWMATVTTRDEGQDCTVYAPCAVATAERD